MDRSIALLQGQPANAAECSALGRQPTSPLQVYFHQFGLRFRSRAEPGLDAWDLVDFADRVGFSGVNFWVMPPEFGWLRGGTDKELYCLRQYAAEKGVGLDVETRGTDPAHLRRVLEVAAKVGAAYLRTYTLPQAESREQIEAAVRDLKIVVEDARRLGVVLLIENHEDLSATEVAEVVERVAHPFLGALFDYGNSMVFLEEPMQSVRALARHSRTAHLKDHVAIPSSMTKNGEPCWLGVPLGRGHIPVMEITQVLLGAGVRRIVYENCWAYATRFRDCRGTGVLGQGAFRYRLPPYPPETFYLGEDLSPETSGMAVLERISGQSGLSWLKASLAEWGVATERELRPSMWPGISSSSQPPTKSP